MLTIRHSSQPDHESTHLGTRRIQFRSILASTDLSAVSTTAIKFAARFAKQFGAYRVYDRKPLQVALTVPFALNGAAHGEAQTDETSTPMLPGVPFQSDSGVR
jgi:hypothetical protein